MKSQDIRKAFLEYFKEQGHDIVSSAPMVIKNDPTLMFTNAGMNQFKDVFLGNIEAKSKRVTDTQKCLRVSGKHNDLEEVGRDTYHHTMFEMLGNWSFGDYFKKEAIAFAWEFLTKRMKIDPSVLYVTVFGGDEQDKTDKDMEAYSYWKEHTDESKILFGNKKDNFWEMGDTGPCGPCSEIHIDLRTAKEKESVSGRDLVNKDHPRVIEIWNLVFMEFNRKADGKLHELPSKHVDTGMGFERLCMVLQAKESNYDTDVFQPLINCIAQMSKIEYGKNEEADIAMRVISDHIRAVAFAIADGQLPSNNKAGYVIRRILRRAVRYGYTFLNFRTAFMYKMIDILCRQMGDSFPELVGQKDLITKVIEEEENAFLRTLETGIRLLSLVSEKVISEGKKEISGEDAFTLYDTYGFPIDLTELILKEQGLSVNISEFEKNLEKQKERSRNDAEVSSDDWVELRSGSGFDFVGYDTMEFQSELLRYRKVNKKGKDLFQLVFDKTPFYAESGGQVGDRGYIESLSSKEKISIIDTKKENKLIIHWAEKLPSDTKGMFRMVVEEGRRQQTACNHTATHLMHHALRQVLGTHVEQKGSQVNELSLRFDFSHFQKMTDEEIREVEIKVNSCIRKNRSLEEFREIPMSKAQDMGAMALFSEKYGDSVRVIKYGDSVELCGGTHVKATGEIGIFKIISEGAVAAGVRRIEAVAAEAAQKYLFNNVDTLHEIRDILHAGPNIIQGIKKMIEGNAAMKKDIEMHINDRISQLVEIWEEKKEIKNGIPYIPIYRGYPAEISRGLCMAYRKRIPDGVCLICGLVAEKPSIYLMIGDELVKKGFNASTLIKESAVMINGSGGGQAFFASAIGKEPSGLGSAVEHILGHLNLM